MRSTKAVFISLSIVGLGMIGLSVPLPVSALVQTEDPSTTTEAPQDRINTRSEDLNERKPENSESRKTQKQAVREKLDAQKMKRCDSRENTVNRAMKNVNDRSQKRFDRITKVYEMTKAFYAKHSLTIEAYDQLVSSVEVAKAQAGEKKELLAAEPSFDCESDKPKATLQDFQAKRKEKVEAYQIYRQAVKEFVNAVRFAAKAQLSESVNSIKKESQNENE